MNDIILLWAFLGLLNLYIFLYIDWDSYIDAKLIKTNWSVDVWVITLVCCVIPPLGWIMFGIIYWAYRQGNN